MDSILPLNPSDIISESMNKINYNFDALANREDITDYKLSQFSKDFQNQLDEMKSTFNTREIGIMRSLDQMGNRITTLPSLDKIQTAIDVAISNSAGNLEEFIRQTAGVQIESALVGYAKTSEYADIDTIISSAFTKYESNAKLKMASMTSIVGNSKFLKKNGHLVWAETDTESSYSTIEGYYNSLSQSEKNAINGNTTYQNPLQDPDVIQRLLAVCEQKFKTVATELAGIEERVGPGFSRTTLLNWIHDDNTDQDITAAIFMEANKDGSGITLSADHLNLKGNKLVIDTENFQVNKNGDHKVKVTGEIVATSLRIGSDTITNSEQLKQLILHYANSGGSGSGSGGGSGSEDDDYSWLNDVFTETDSVGGILLAGNIFTKNGSGNITAGIMGGNTSDGTAVRFFSGTNNGIDSIGTASQNAKFRVLNNGKLYATDAEITGSITATSLTIKDGNENKSLRNFVLGIGTEKGWGETSGEPSGGDGSDNDYDDSWLTGAFKEIDAEGGILLAGNLLVGSSEGNVTAGVMGANTSGDDIRFWAGTNFNNRNNANFKVTKSGKLYAKNAEIEGNITANDVNSISSTGMSTIINNGNLKIYKGSSSNSSNLRAEFGLDGDSVVLKFYDNTGTLLYDLGPNGITHEGETVYPPDWMRYAFKSSSTVYQVNDIFDYEDIVATATTFYQYTDGTKFKYNGDIEYYNPSTKSYSSSHSSFHNKWFTTNTASDSNLVKSSSGTIYYYVNPDKWDQRSTSDTTIVCVIIATTSGHRQGSITLDSTGKVIATNYS